MTVTFEFSQLDEVEKRELAELMLEVAEEKGLAVNLPERTKPYTVKEATAELGLCPATIYTHIKAGNLTAIKALDKKMITASSLHAFRDAKF